ncbi:cysteine desulfurase family protein [Pelagovum pacificum]|uniref:Cysteine desulfurase n=1 Tax=Pelagovum pacificum TaxID=2588711 RepID=A0A5C5GBN6_9RHOB|nr:aminotransferase class V-fold PLP-dependent enzyme [Pelagovum pacificum]QQA44688.1 aminotransferase class V-fold PLP-dependent enzyme [Pelagovum pacificum]TNY32202.1 aminotransferase class V-fold PLP-dependent enzyme [Pelagovum pacificum]
MTRTYLDFNATSPLRAEARDAMVAAFDLVGNPSSVHSEGRAAKGLLESSRAAVAEAVGASNADVVFTSGSTEAAALALAGRALAAAPIEHDAVWSWAGEALPVDADGLVSVAEPDGATLQFANSETGVLQALPQGLAVSDITQGFGRVPFAFSWSGVGMVFLSAHKFGGPKGVGALVFPQGTDLAAQIRGGGQEMGRRSGTENLAGIAGMAAAATAAQRDLADGVWDRVAQLRNILENAIAAGSDETIFVGKAADRLPNTSCFVTPGWKGETQVMTMDLAGFAISAGSACSSGKVKESRVLRAMGYDADTAGSAIRVSLGPTTTEDEVLRFAEAWTAKLRRHRARAA